jgi:hypothetical protein
LHLSVNKDVATPISWLRQAMPCRQALPRYEEQRKNSSAAPPGLAFCRKTTPNSSNDPQSSDRRLLSELCPLYGRIVAQAVFGAWRIDAPSVVSTTEQSASMRAFPFARKSFNHSSHAKGVTG